MWWGAPGSICLWSARHESPCGAALDRLRVPALPAAVAGKVFDVVSDPAFLSEVTVRRAKRLLSRSRCACTSNVGDPSTGVAATQPPLRGRPGLARRPPFPWSSQVNRKGDRLKNGLKGVLEGVSHVAEVRGMGLLVGVQLDVPAGPVVTACRDKGVLVITAGAGDVVRLVPPLTLTDEDIDLCVRVLSDAIKAL